jgi:hypothetical protein
MRFSGRVAQQWIGRFLFETEHRVLSDFRSRSTDRPI